MSDFPIRTYLLKVEVWNADDADRADGTRINAIRRDQALILAMDAIDLREHPPDPRHPRAILNQPASRTISDLTDS